MYRPKNSLKNQKIDCAKIPTFSFPPSLAPVRMADVEVPAAAAVRERGGGRGRWARSQTDHERDARVAQRRRMSTQAERTDERALRGHRARS